MRVTLAALVLLLATHAWALFGTQLNYEVRNAQDRPAQGAFVVARELGELGKLHGTVTYCIRAAAKPASTGVTKLELPAATIEAVMLGERRLEVLAYRPGHCVARVKNVESAVLRLRPAPQRPDERLPYLEELAASLACRRGAWSAGSDAAIEKLSAAIEGEVKPLVRGPWEREIASRISAHLKFAKGFPSLEDLSAHALVAEPKLPPPRDFIIVPANYGAKFDDQKALWLVAPPTLPAQVISLSAPSGNRPGNAVGVVGALEPIPGAIIDGGAAAYDRAPASIRCRFGAPSKCNLDQRDAQGETALGNALRYFKVEEVKMLLAAGADPAVPTTPGGLPAVDLVLQRMKGLSPKSWEADQGRQLLAMLAPNPKTRITKALKEDLAADPSSWNNLRNAPGLPLVAEVRGSLAGVAVRDDVAPCEPLNVLSPFRTETHAPPMRLRGP